MLILQSSNMPRPRWRVPAPPPGAGTHRHNLLLAPGRDNFLLVCVLQGLFCWSVHLWWHSCPLTSFCPQNPCCETGMKSCSGATTSILNSNYQKKFWNLCAGGKERTDHSVSRGLAVSTCLHPDTEQVWDHLMTATNNLTILFFKNPTFPPPHPPNSATGMCVITPIVQRRKLRLRGPDSQGHRGSRGQKQTVSPSLLQFPWEPPGVPPSKRADRGGQIPQQQRATGAANGSGAIKAAIGLCFLLKPCSSSTILC